MVWFCLAPLIAGQWAINAALGSEGSMLPQTICRFWGMLVSLLAARSAAAQLRSAAQCNCKHSNMRSALLALALGTASHQYPAHQDRAAARRRRHRRLRCRPSRRRGLRRRGPQPVDLAEGELRDLRCDEGRRVGVNAAPRRRRVAAGARVPPHCRKSARGGTHGRRGDAARHHPELRTVQRAQGAASGWIASHGGLRQSSRTPTRGLLLGST